mgnify:CR=1 FL=1|jgi:hypothetical protein
MFMASRKTWSMALAALLGVAVILCAYLMISGKRFATQAVFAEIQSIATENQANDTALIAELNRQFAGVTDPARQDDLHQAIQEIKDNRLGFICIDDSTLNLFSPEQRSDLEQSLTGYYAKVFWGQGNIPASLTREDGGLKNGLVFGCSIKVYPGIVKLRYQSWSGFMSAGGHTNVYVWNGVRYRLRGKTGVWIS